MHKEASDCGEAEIRVGSQEIIYLTEISKAPVSHALGRGRPGGSGSCQGETESGIRDVRGPPKQRRMDTKSGHEAHPGASLLH